MLDTQWSDGQNVEWFDLIGNQPNIIPFISAYNDKKKKRENTAEVQDCTKIEDIYEFFAADEILENANTQTNICAAQSTKTSKRLDKWIPANKN